MMRIVLGGVRGTIPVSHADFMHYGGSTTSVLVEDRAGTRLVIDAGTGLRTLEPRLAAAGADAPVLMLFTHYHLDHLIGLPAFMPLFDADWHVTFAAPLRHTFSAEEALRRLTADPFWPAAFKAQQRFLVLPDEPGEAPLRHGSLAVRWCGVHHHSGCHAYRVDDNDSGGAMVFATDIEWQASSAAEREALLRLCRTPRPADILIMDGQFDASESARFAGWGHSTWQDTVEVAAAAGVERLVVTHHAPESRDTVLDQREVALKATRAHARLAREGMTIELGRHV